MSLSWFQCHGQNFLLSVSKGFPHSSQDAVDKHYFFCGLAKDDALLTHSKLLSCTDQTDQRGSSLVYIECESVNTWGPGEDASGHVPACVWMKIVCVCKGQCMSCASFSGWKPKREVQFVQSLSVHYICVKQMLYSILDRYYMLTRQHHLSDYTFSAHRTQPTNQILHLVRFWERFVLMWDETSIFIKRAP